MNNSNLLITSHPLDANVNVFIRVIDKKGRVAQEIAKHNKATRNMTEGIIRFLRGEFNTTFLREFKDSINNIGDNSEISRQYIPTHIGIGNIGIGLSTGKVPEGLTSFDPIYQPSYSDTALRQEILPKYNQHRAKIRKSTKGDSTIADTYSLNLQGYYQFNQKINEDVFNFVYANSGSPVTQFIESNLKCITITELGLFSGDINDSGSRLLARLLLDSKTPLILSEDDTLIINWQIGMYSLNERLITEGQDDYDYQTITIADGLSWDDQLNDN